MRRLAVVAAIGIAAAVGGCASPGADTKFVAPDGWTGTPGIMGRFQMWMNGSGDANRQILMLIRGDKDTATITDIRSSNSGTNVSDLKTRNISMCGGNQPAEYITGRGTNTRGSHATPELLEGVETMIGDSKYIAMYIRPASMKTGDSQAEASLRSLCPK
jgi:hypothetical protein